MTVNLNVAKFGGWHASKTFIIRSDIKCDSLIKTTPVVPFNKNHLCLLNVAIGIADKSFFTMPVSNIRIVFATWVNPSKYIFGKDIEDKCEYV